MKDNDIRDVLMALAEAVASTETDKAQLKLLKEYKELADVSSRITERYGVNASQAVTLEQVNQANGYITACVQTLKEFEEKMR